MVQGPHAISLNQCCCGEPGVGCLEGVCFVTVEFQNVKNPVVVPNVGEADRVLCPPNLGLGCNDPAQGIADQPGDIQPVCTECEDWNREWELVLLPEVGDPDQKLGDGSINFKFILAQERDTEDEGFTAEGGRAYDLPGGSTCFPCADVNDDTGIILIIDCHEQDDEGNEQISANLSIRVKGCELVSWTWSIYPPKFFNADRTQGIPQPASDINFEDFEIGWTENAPAGSLCYTPRGLCEEDIGKVEAGEAPLGVFPCFTSKNIATFYDRENCYWSNTDEEGEPSSLVPPDGKPLVRLYLCEASTDVDNPDECDVCIDENVLFDSDIVGESQIAVSTAPGTATVVEVSPYDKPEKAIKDHVFRLTTGADFADFPQIIWPDGDPCPPPGGSPQDSVICIYEVYLRWGRNTSLDQSVTVAIYTAAPDFQGSGEPIDVTFDDLPLAGATLDGGHNTHVLVVNGEGFRFRRLGTIKVACDASLRIEFSGPRDPGAVVDFDAIVLKRL